MIFTCNNCNAQYKISDDRIPEKGAKVKCKRCGNIITIKRPDISEEDTARFQNEATVVQRSPFSEEGEAGVEATRVVSQEQAASIFKSLISEHTQQGEEEEYGSDKIGVEGYSGSQYEEEGSADDRLTAVYESPQSSEGQDTEAEEEYQAGDVFQQGPEEEDISREATRVVSTEQLKQMFGEEEQVGNKSEGRVSQQDYYSRQDQYYAPQRPRGEWYVAIGQMQVGPLSLNEVEEKWGRGEINSTTLVWKAGMPTWQPLMYVPELAHLVPPIQESRVAESQPEMKEFNIETKKKEEPQSESSSSLFPSLDELSRQEEELKAQKEEEPPLDWKPAASEALASLAKDELESIERGFSTDIPITPKSSDSISVAIPAESPVLPFEKPQEPVTPAPVIPQPSTPPVSVEQPVIISTPPTYQAPYPAPYPPLYSQPPQKAEKSKLIPILATVLGLILVVGAVAAYFIFKNLAGEKISPTASNIQQQAQQQPQLQQAPQQQAQQQPQPQPPQQLAMQAQQGQQAQVQEQPQKEEVKKEAERGEGQVKAREERSEIKETKKEPQRQKVAQREQRVDKEPKRVTQKEPEMPPPPREETRPKKEELAKEEEPPTKKRSSKGGSDSLLDFEEDKGSKGGSGGLPKTLTQEQILEVVKANIGRIKTCMAEQAQRDPSVKGKLVIGWEIQPNGKTKNVQIKSPQFKGTYIGTCISSVVTDFTFPKFSGPPIPIEFPFNIK